jgi:hypothetical protein
MALIPLLGLLIMIGALIDIILRSEWQVKHIHKFGWILLVIFLPFIGSILWFTLGREYPTPAPRTHTGGGRHHGQAQPVGFERPKSTEEQLAELEREIEFFRQKEQLAALEREIEAYRQSERPQDRLKEGGRELDGDRDPV